MVKGLVLQSPPRTKARGIKHMADHKRSLARPLSYPWMLTLLVGTVPSQAYMYVVDK